MTRRRIVMLEALAVIAVTVGGFAALQYPMRRFETVTSAALAGLLGPHHIFVLGGPSLLEFPYRGSAYKVTVAPSCSSTASVVSIAALGLLIRRGSRWRRLAATGAAVAAVVCGNILRIAGSLAVGLFAGRASLVLFHNWVGTVFAFAYTVGGFILLLCIVLGDRRATEAEALSPRFATLGSPLA